MPIMKIKDADILLIPGFKNAGPGHWQTRWEARMDNARRVKQHEWNKPVRDDWIAQVRAQISACERPVILVGHSLGVAAAVHATADLAAWPHANKVVGGFYVAPPEVTNPKVRPRHFMTFGPYPQTRLPYPAFVIASRTDQFAGFEQTEATASHWGAFLVDAGDAGHIDDASGHGPWPEGLMVFAQFMKQL